MVQQGFLILIFVLGLSCKSNKNLSTQNQLLDGPENVIRGCWELRYSRNNPDNINTDKYIITDNSWKSVYKKMANLVEHGNQGELGDSEKGTDFVKSGTYILNFLDRNYSPCNVAQELISPNGNVAILHPRIYGRYDDYWLANTLIGLTDPLYFRVLNGNSSNPFPYAVLARDPVAAFDLWLDFSRLLNSKGFPTYATIPPRFEFEVVHLSQLRNELRGRGKNIEPQSFYIELFEWQPPELGGGVKAESLALIPSDFTNDNYSLGGPRITRIEYNDLVNTLRITKSANWLLK